MRAGGMRWAVAACAFLLAGVAVADGRVMPPVAETRIPGIPNQQAIVVFKDGVERLIVQSTVDGKGGELAWLVPVPAEPTEIKTAERGVFVGADVIFGPHVIDFKTWMWEFAIPLLVSIFVLIRYGRHAFTITFVVGFAVATVVYIAEPNLLGIESGPFPGLGSTPARTVGNYTVQTLQADTPEALNQWLGQNGFQGIPKSGEAVVADYIKQGWRFVAAKLRSEADGLLRPHPLSITFPAKAPVYPMRMTQWAGTDLHLDLYVIAGQRMTVKGMDTVYSDQFRASSEFSHNNRDPFHFICFKSAKLETEVIFPPLAALLWDGCVVSRLSATMKNKKLGKDFSIVPTTWQTAHQLHYFSPRGAFYFALSCAVFIGGFLLIRRIFKSDLPNNQRVGAKDRFRASVRGLLPGIVIFVLLLLLLPITPVRLTPEKGSLGPRFYGYDFFGAFESGALKDLNKAQLESWIKEKLSGKINPLTGEPFAFEAIPGDVEVLEAADGRLVIRIYRIDGWWPGIGYPDDRLVDDPAMWR